MGPAFPSGLPTGSDQSVRLAGTTYFASIWEQRTDGDWKAFVDLTGKEYGSERDRLLRRGYRPVDLSGYTGDSAPRFAGIFEKSTRTVVAETQLTGAQLNSQHDHLAGSGHRLVRLSGYGLGLTPNFAAIWELSTGPTQDVSPVTSRASFGVELDNGCKRVRFCVLGWPLAGQGGRRTAT